MRVKLPLYITQPISNNAAQKVRVFGQARGWSATNKIIPMAADGEVSLFDPTNILVFQEKGTKAYLMHWVQGRIIPMGNGHFVRGKEVGQPGYVTIPAGVNIKRRYGKAAPTGFVQGDGSLRVWRDQKWLHPAMKANPIMQRSIDQAIEEAEPEIRAYMLKLLKGGV